MVWALLSLPSSCFKKTMFQPTYGMGRDYFSEQVLQVIRNIAFGNILNIGAAYINNHLITTLIEIWRRETHTFHFSNGECTITLEEVVTYHLGLPIN
ncbi:hypothetical protein Lal_00025998 [Lupinus albus]|nr:hypothetical protein Lal_00025998 [Lupinus albus]